MPRQPTSKSIQYLDSPMEFASKLRLGFAKTRYRVAQAADDALLPENGHGVEERGRDGLADNRDARGVDQQAGLDAGGFCDRARGMLASIVVPLGEFFERVGKLREQFWDFGVFPEFFLRRLVTREFIAEKRARPRRKIRQQADSRTQQIHGF